MVLWVLTAGIGVYLLAAGIAAQRQVAGRAQPAPGGAALAPVSAAPEQTADGALVVGAAALASGAVLGSAAVAAGGARDAEGSPLLEFIHPLLALLGLTFWIFFVMTGYRLFAWMAFGVVVATVLAGLSWVAVTRRTAGPRAPGARTAGARAPGARTARRRTAGPRAAGARAAGRRTAGPRAAGRRGGGREAADHGFPAHLVMIHGLAAACTLALVVIAAVTASHG
jgi:heme exporter protein D